MIRAVESGPGNSSITRRGGVRWPEVVPVSRRRVLDPVPAGGALGGGTRERMAAGIRSGRLGLGRKPALYDEAETDELARQAPPRGQAWL